MGGFQMELLVRDYQNNFETGFERFELLISKKLGKPIEVTDSPIFRSLVF
jgi:hypothetical protein